jgi:hypothetical protein
VSLGGRSLSLTLGGGVRSHMNIIRCSPNPLRKFLLSALSSLSVFKYLYSCYLERHLWVNFFLFRKLTNLTYRGLDCFVFFSFFIFLLGERGWGVYLLGLPVKERLQNDGEFIWSLILRNVNTSEFWVQSLGTLWNISYFNCGWFELGIMRRAIMPIMALVCLRLGTSWNASQSICCCFFNLQTHQEHIRNVGLFLLLVGFSLLVGYNSLGSVSTLTKWIIILFQKMKSFSSFEIIYFSIVYYNIVIWVAKLFRV